MGNLLNSEIFRTVKRPVSWIMLLILGVIVAAFYTVVYFASSDRATTETLRPDQVVANGIAIGGTIASILVIVLAAQSMGSEYGWNTIRALVSRASGRVPLILAKLVVIIGYTLLTILVVTGASLALAFLFAAIAGNDTSMTGGAWREVAESVGRWTLSNGVYAVLALVITILSRSTAAGIAGAIALSFLEPAIWAALGAASDRFETVSHWFLAYNASGLAAMGTDGAVDDFNTTRGFIIVAAWLVGLMAISLWVFRRRDITSG